MFCRRGSPNGAWLPPRSLNPGSSSLTPPTNAVGARRAPHCRVRCGAGTLVLRVTESAPLIEASRKRSIFERAAESVPEHVWRTLSGVTEACYTTAGTTA
ncbi:hypothetical protein MRX96_052846 [Rhipicephalus microplus]